MELKSREELRKELAESLELMSCPGGRSCECCAADCDCGCRDDCPEYQSLCRRMLAEFVRQTLGA